MSSNCCGWRVDPACSFSGGSVIIRRMFDRGEDESFQGRDSGRELLRRLHADFEAHRGLASSGVDGSSPGGLDNKLEAVVG